MTELEEGRDLALIATRQASTQTVDRSSSAASHAALRPTSRVGNYLVLRTLGQGGMGTVYVAYHEELDRKVALKLVHAESGGSTGGRARLLREAQALARLSHPNVVQIYEVGEHEGKIFLAMEFVDGEPLEAWQDAPGRSLSEIVEAYAQAAKGLRAAHEAGLIHRDFKPDNVLVGRDGRVRVLDFGLARSGQGGQLLSAGAEALRSSADLDRTAPGSIAGTPAYMSPEQFEGEVLDLRSDIFSFSVALWEATYRERPFPGKTLEALRMAVCGDHEVRPPSGKDVPLRLERALLRGLARDRERRPSSMEPLIEALSIDPVMDPSASREARQHFFAVAGATLILGPLLGMSSLLGHLGKFDRMSNIGALLGLGLLTTVGVAFRTTLMRNLYHRRILLFIAVLGVVGGSQRMIATARGVPIEEAIMSSLHITVSAALVAAIFFAPWMLAVAGIAAAGILVGVLWPQLFPAGMLFFGPAIIFTLGYFWNRDAKLGTHRPRSSPAAAGSTSLIRK